MIELQWTIYLGQKMDSTWTTKLLEMESFYLQEIVFETGGVLSTTGGEVEQQVMSSNDGCRGVSGLCTIPL